MYVYSSKYTQIKNQMAMSFKLKDAHWEILISFLEEHSNMATGRFSGPNGRESNKKLWARLSQQLNSLGLGERTPEKWQKTWTDFKYLLKKKASIIQTDLSKTGEGPSETSPLSSFEKRASLILGDSFYKGTGCPEVAVISNNAPRMEEVGRQPLDQPSSSSSVPTLRPEAHLEHDYSFQRPPKKRKGIIDEAYEETISVLKEIRNVVDSRLEQISNSIDKLAEVLKSK